MCGVLINSLSTLFAAFLGALAAFLLQDWRNKRREDARKRSAVNRAIFDLSMLWNDLEQYRKEIIEPVRTSSAPWLNMQANVSTQFHNLSFNFDELFFLVDAEKADLLQKLFLEESRYRITLDIIEERSKIVLSWLQPKMESLGYTKDGKIDIKELESKLGPDLTYKLKSLTDAIIQFIDENLTSMYALNSEFTAEMEALFEGKKVLKVQYETKTGSMRKRVGESEK